MNEQAKSDVMIIGAGPAGCAAAYDLASHGVSVQLLDKAEFPREKPCAGGLTMKAVKALRFSVDDVVQRECHTCVLGFKTTKRKALRSNYPIVAMTVRREFDEFHLNRCLERGVSFACVTDDLKLSGSDGKWIAQSPGNTYTSSYLIGADGAHSCVRRSFNLFPNLKCGFALEIEVPVPNALDFEMEFDFGVVDEGYAWVFPKRDHLNVGLYSLGKIPNAKQRLIEYCHRKLGVPATGTVMGHPIPYNGHTYRHVAGTPLLVGDAAGFVDPLMGEGLYNAIRSGQLAADAIVRMQKGEPDRYDSLIREITKDLQSYRRETRLFYNHLKWGYRTLTFPPIAYVLMKGYAIGKPVRWLKRHLPLLPFLRP